MNMYGGMIRKEILRLLLNVLKKLEQNLQLQCRKRNIFLRFGESDISGIKCEEGTE